MASLRGKKEMNIVPSMDQWTRLVILDCPMCVGDQSRGSSTAPRPVSGAAYVVKSRTTLRSDGARSDNITREGVENRILCGPA
jgi:hypothetical protein